MKTFVGVPGPLLIPTPLVFSRKDKKGFHVNEHKLEVVTYISIFKVTPYVTIKRLLFCR